MKRILSLLSAVIFILMLSVSSHAEKNELIRKDLKILKVKSHKSFEVDTIGNCYLAGVSGPRFSDEVFAEAMKEVEKFIKENKNPDGTHSMLLEKEESVTKNGQKRTTWYVIINGKSGLSLNEFLVKRGICYTNKYSEKYFNAENIKKLEDEAKSLKLYKWSDNK